MAAQGCSSQLQRLACEWTVRLGGGIVQCSCMKPPLLSCPCVANEHRCWSLPACIQPTLPAGLERFATVPDEDRLAELEGLREYLKAAVEAVDTAAASLAAPQERLKRLLEAKDKKAMLLEMAGACWQSGVNVVWWVAGTLQR